MNYGQAIVVDVQSGQVAELDLHGGYICDNQQQAEQEANRLNAENDLEYAVCLCVYKVTSN